ncbi:complement factor H-like isoform X2 [Parambassis ranga]|uniref:Complement factor H-like isoform X2 n=1 Tax=Parambassis ranga TaxID=210632 RepID=A0A6P7K284_9TELE|nr:complement factor H-like isoform X2 [Parambassis ranga]
MCISWLGFALLIWLPGLLHGQPCPAPKLDDGYVIPQKNSFHHDDSLTYGCDSGLKPAAEGWWATSTCQNGKWSHEPQCISENACLPPTIKNGNITANTKGWYENGSRIEVTCNEGYELKAESASIYCTDSIWSPLRVCKKSTNACSEPPKRHNAAIISGGYREVFAHNTEVQYICKEGYNTDGTNSEGSIRCSSGSWNEGPECREPGHGGPAAEETHTSVDSGPQTAGGGCHQDDIQYKRCP